MTKQVINPDDKDLHDRTFKVSFVACQPGELVYADNAQDAIDIYADHAEEQGWTGLFLDDGDIADWDWQGEDIDYVGNSGLPILSHEIYVGEV